MNQSHANIIADFNKEVAEVKALLIPRPKSWSRSTKLGYYKEVFARELVPLLNKLITLDLDKETMYVNGLPKGISGQSLSLRYNQAWMYLIDNLDPTGAWKELRETVEIRRSKDGVTFVRKAKYTSGISIGVEDVSVVRTAPRAAWKDDFEKFIDNAVENEKLEKKGLSLDLDEQNTIRTCLINMPEFHLIKLDKNNLLVIKCSTVKKDS